MGRVKIRSWERDKISILVAQEQTISEIARQLNRSKGTISEEIKRNRRWDEESGQWVYEAIYAHEETIQKRKRARRRPLLKNKWIYQYVIEGLRRGWSPEQIEGRLKRDYLGEYHKNIGHEAIYQYIYSEEVKEEKLWEYLPRKQKKRKKQTGRYVHKSRIPNRVSISKRPEVVNNREEFGHWEGDTVEGQRGVGDGIRTEVERKSRYLIARKVGKIAAEETIQAQLAIFSSIPLQARKSETMDNGKEHHKHEQLQNQLSMKTYFCHPYASCERGTNENTNGLLRRYFPKKTDLSTVTQEELDDVVFEINTKPRKVLNYQTPLEVFIHLLSDRSD